MSNLIIAGNNIRLTDGLYSLNDLHKASGGEPRHKPANWLATQQTSELVKELSKSGIPDLEQNQELADPKVIQVVHGGANPGTYVCKELVYAYAMWISAAFNLRVIRAFDGMMLQANRAADDLEVPARSFTALVGAMKAIGLDTNAAAISANQAVLAAAGVNILQLTGNTHLLAEKQERWYTPTELGRMCDPVINPRNINLLLAAHDLQVKTGDVWVALQAGEDYSRLFGTGKRHGNGAPVLQLKWSNRVLDIIMPKR